MFVFSFSSAQADNTDHSKKIRFGVVGGYTNLSASFKVTTKVTVLSNTVENTVETSESGSGFFIGGVAEKSITKNIGVHLGVNYQNIKVKDDDASALNISLSGSYYLFNLFKREKRFSIELGANYDLQFSEGAVSGIGIIAGVGYDITNNIFTNIRYIPTFTNRFETATAKGVETSGNASYNYLQIGVGYRF